MQMYYNFQDKQQLGINIAAYNPMQISKGLQYSQIISQVVQQEQINNNYNNNQQLELHYNDGRQQTNLNQQQYQQENESNSDAYDQAMQQNSNVQGDKQSLDNVYNSTNQQLQQQPKLSNQDMYNYSNQSEINQQNNPSISSQDQQQQQVNKSKKITKTRTKQPSKYIKIDHNCKTCENCLRNNFKIQEKCHIYVKHLKDRKRSTAAELRKKKKDETEQLMVTLSEQSDKLKEYQNLVEQYRQNELKLKQQMEEQTFTLKGYINVNKSLITNIEKKNKKQQDDKEINEKDGGNDDIEKYRKQVEILEQQLLDSWKQDLILQIKQEIDVKQESYDSIQKQEDLIKQVKVEN